MTAAAPTVVCLFEDREDCMLGVQLLVLSARRHEPDWFFHAFLRNANPDQAQWFARQPNVRVRSADDTCPGGWNIKPSLLRRLLAETRRAVIWCDSDIILAGAVTPLLACHDETCFIATEEYGWGRARGSRLRAAGWDLTEVRPLKNTVNSCFMRVAPCHATMLEAWDAMMASDQYRDAQRSAWQQRPLHMVSDQDVLTALLASPAFAVMPMHLLANGHDIAQCFQEDGYTVGQRLRNAMLRRTPPLVHAQGGKPWKRGRRAFYQTLSPYIKIAAPYVKTAGLPDYWLEADDFPSRCLDRLFFHDANLCGIVPAARKTLSRAWRHRPWAAH